MKTTDTAIAGHRIVSREEWTAARKELLRKEKELTRLRDQLASERHALPWAADLQDLSGDSVFFKDEADEIFLTYSTFGRGGEEFLGIYRYLDATPKGRNENGPFHTLADWVRPRNLYGQGGIVEANGRYHQPGCSCAVQQSAAA